jgi:hypothetical protein
MARRYCAKGVKSPRVIKRVRMDSLIYKFNALEANGAHLAYARREHVRVRLNARAERAPRKGEAAGESLRTFRCRSR